MTDMYPYPLGNRPELIGNFAIDSPEMMFYLYLPIKIPSSMLCIPRRLEPFSRLVHASLDREGNKGKYVYLTVKTMPIHKSSPGNRPGWHIDGFGSNGDINYTWANANPTEYAIQEFHGIPSDDVQSMVEIDRQIDPEHIETYNNCDLMRLDETVVHRVSPNAKPCIRTFFKLTISGHRFRNQGNSHNYLIDYDWSLKPRNITTRSIDH